jgi:hypothetical protein
MAITAILAAIVGLFATDLLAGPPSGRPPAGALERHDPRIWRVGFEVELHVVASPQLPRDITPDRFNLQGTEFFFPIIRQSTFSSVDPDSLNAMMWLDNVEQSGVNERGRIDDGLPFATSLAVIPLPEFSGDNVRWRFEQSVMVWSSRINDRRAGAIAWPREWPDEVRGGLRPQRFIESDDPIFRETVERISEGQLRMVPPYYAAKDIVRYVLQNVQVSGARTHRGELMVIQGLNVTGARATAMEGMGSPHDVVCLCVAMLRAAGIPARPVVGLERRSTGAPGQRTRLELISWAEFYLPETGWVPFDPVSMQGKGLHREVHQAWPDFGTIRDLNERVPLAYGFTPARGNMGPGRGVELGERELPSLWSWNPSGSLRPDLRQQIRPSMESLGRP